jgi:hypothetical protein
LASVEKKLALHAAEHQLQLSSAPGRIDFVQQDKQSWWVFTSPESSGSAPRANQFVEPPVCGPFYSLFPVCEGDASRTRSYFTISMARLFSLE